MSEIKVNKISPRAACGTVQLGDSGDTFTIPAGASITNSGTASGFGATGSASWNTTVKTSGFTAVAGEGYFVNTTGGAISVNLPAGTAGAVVAFKDYANTFDTNELTLVQNGSDKVGGSTDNVVLGEEGVAITLVFVDSTQGWLVTDSGLQSEATVPEFVSASGGNAILTCGNFKTHVFTGPGTFTVSSAGNTAGSNRVDYVVVAGGGGGGGGRNCASQGHGGGAGAGGMRLSNSYCLPAPTTSPLANPSGITVTATAFPIAVGGGGSGGVPSAAANQGSIGTSSTFSIITSTGGGGGKSAGNLSSTPIPQNGNPGGSGGGAGNPNGTAGAGNTPPVSPPQGQDGGAGAPNGRSAGGGGAGAAGSGGSGPHPGNGGDGSFIADSFFGPTAPSYGTPGPVSSTRYFAGGGAGSAFPPQGYPAGAGGAGGGAPGAQGGGPNSQPGNTGTVNTGGGSSPAQGGYSAGGVAGGSGIVMIRYRFQ